MRKVIFAVIVICLFLSASCKKSGPGPAGYWTFQGSTYDASSCSGANGQLNASNLDNNDPYTYGTIQCQFYHNLPVTGGTFTVAPYPLHDSTQVSISLVIDGGNIGYDATGGGGNQTVKVTVKNGYISVSGSGIEMVNVSGLGNDSSALTININQTQ